MIREEYFTPITELNSGPLAGLSCSLNNSSCAHPGLKVNLLFCFNSFSGTVSFQASQNKTFINSY